MNLLDFLSGPYTMDCYKEPVGKKGSSQRKYENKNKNIEHYTDEKGNIRRRKLK